MKEMKKGRIGKSILVIDTPEKCDKCPMFTINNGTLDIFCVGFVGERKQIGTYRTMCTQKPDWCPLRDFPGKADYPDCCDNGRYDKGWNQCLNDILKSGD